MADDRFVPFAILLREGAAALPVAPPAVPAAAAVPVGPAHPAELSPGGGDEFFGELALLRASALEAFERAAARLLRGLADEVLARELALAPCDTAALVGRFLAELAAFEPLALAVAPADAGRVRAPLPVRVEPALRAGDAIVEVRDGAFESRVTLRLESLVGAAFGDFA